MTNHAKPSTPHERVRVLLAEDSQTAREHLALALSTDKQLEIHAAVDGFQAVAMARELEPDVVVVDLLMPGLDGFEVTKEIMARCPTAVVIVSENLDVHQSAVTARALEAGAVGVLAKPSGDGREMMQFVQVVRALSRVRVRRRPQSHRPDLAKTAELPLVVGIAVPRGGTQALIDLLRGLPAGFAAPLVVAQDGEHGFSPALADLLTKATPHTVRMAREGDQVEAGTVLLVPDNQHLRVSERGIVTLYQSSCMRRDETPAAFLLDSLATEFRGRAVGVILGDDATTATLRPGIEALRRCGGLVMVRQTATIDDDITPLAVPDDRLPQALRTLVERRLPPRPATAHTPSTVSGSPAEAAPVRNETAPTAAPAPCTC